MRSHGPPRLAEFLLGLCLPRGGYRESVLGDLEERFRALRATRGAGRALIWYWSQTVTIGAGYTVRRLIRRRRFGSLEDGNGTTTRRRGMIWSEMTTDVRFALRSYARSPGVLFVALLTLALSIGANAAIFSIVETVYFEPLPYEEPEELVRVGLTRMEGEPAVSVHTAGGFAEWRRRTRSYESIAAWGYTTVTVDRAEVSEQITAATSIGSIFDVLGRDALLGRTFTAAEEGPGAQKLVVLSHRLWRRWYGDTDPVGSTLVIDGVTHDILGVMPEEFTYPRGAELWITDPRDAETLSLRNNFFLRTVARLAPGATVERAREEMEVIAADTRDRFPETYGGIGIHVAPMQEWLRAGVGNLWWLLMAGVGLVLLIGCANLANLLLARATNRRSEFAVRRALGAGEGRLVRQTLTESVVLSLIGGALGVLVARGLLRVVLAWMPGGVPRSESVAIDPAVLAFTAGISILAGILFGTVPALDIRRQAIGDRLRSRGGAGRTSRALISLEMAMAVLLLSAAGLTARSFAALSAEDPGIRVADVYTLPLSIPGERSPEERHALYRELEGRVAALPGVRSAGLTSVLSVVDFNPGAWVNEPGVRHEGADRPGAKYQVVSPGYFETVGIERLRGRGLTRDDGVAGTRSVLVSRNAADELFPGEDPIGKQFDLGLDGDIAPLSTVVGVVDDVKLDGLDEPAPGAVYAVQELVPWWQGFHLMIRVEPGAPAPEGVREALLSVDPGISWLGMRSLDDVFGDALSGRRETMLLFGVLGFVGLVLAAIGVFGVLAFVVGRQSREIGIRIAIGADPGSVRLGVLRQGMVPVVVGLALGLAGTVGLGRLMESLIFGVRPLDPVTLAGVSALMMAVGAVAIWLPASRASKVDPVRVLEAE